VKFRDKTNQSAMSFIYSYPNSRY